jgi:hypothetical protein
LEQKLIKVNCPFKGTIERIHYTIKVIEIFFEFNIYVFTLFLISSFLLVYFVIIEEQGKNGYFISNN